MPPGSKEPRSGPHGLALLREQFGDNEVRAALTSPVYGSRFRAHAERCTAGCRDIMNELFPEGIQPSDTRPPEIDWAVWDRALDDCPGSIDP